MFLVLLLLFLNNLVVLNGDQASFDCPMRQQALEYAALIQPNLSQRKLQEIADALNGATEAVNCTTSPLKLANINNIPYDNPKPSWNDLESSNYHITLFVDKFVGTELSKGTIEDPLDCINSALNKLRNIPNSKYLNKRIILREGRYYLENTIVLYHFDSNLLITNYDNENVEVSGAIPLKSCHWKLYKNTQDNKGIYYTDLSNISSTFNNWIPGLRVNGSRGIRARYPNANPEIDGFGSSNMASSWYPPNPDSIIPDEEIYPKEPIRNDTYDEQFIYYQAGIGGICNYFNPPGGYWCGSKTEGGGAFTFRVPLGLTYNKTILPNAPYRNTTGGIVSTWRPAHWASWFFLIGEYSSSDMSMNFSLGGFQGARGDDMGAEFYVENIFEELDYPNEWYYNSTSKLLYLYNNLTGYSQLPNCDTLDSNGNYLYEVTHHKILMNFYGNRSYPVENITIRGVTFRDTAYTYLDPHFMPSGGDWTIARQGAITIHGGKNILITESLFTRLDGNSIILNNYNRYITISYNEFVWNGDTCIGLIGDTEGIDFEAMNNDNIPYTYATMGWDGTSGNQPQYINVSYNYAHEFGIWEKQSSFYFQAKSCYNTISYNIAYNGPRAIINFNDGYGGGSNVTRNLLFNSCRESGDHGVFNSWDRQVYQFIDRNTNEVSVIKEYDYISYNYMIGDYEQVQDVIDNDDGSCYYKTYNNFLVYAPNGLKTDSGGHDNHHYNNIYGYIGVHSGWDWWGPTCFDNWANQLAGHNIAYYNNKCIIRGYKDPYAAWDCTRNISTWPILGNNSIYIMNQSVGLCGMNESYFQTFYNYDLGTTINKLPNDSQLLDWVKQLLWF